MTDDTKRPGQEEIDASKAPLLDHLIELRKRLIYALLSFAAVFIITEFPQIVLVLPQLAFPPS